MFVDRISRDLFVDIEEDDIKTVGYLSPGGLLFVCLLTAKRGYSVFLLKILKLASPELMRNPG
ncbi:MAG: hypothetical protein CSA33_05440 [Desulfobulbus propionicus]|nr:MAG: hypothetical protein CSA33_05440 [Desulfobulbus propionicus]